MRNVQVEGDRKCRSAVRIESPGVGLDWTGERIIVGDRFCGAFVECVAGCIVPSALSTCAVSCRVST